MEKNPSVLQTDKGTGEQEVIQFCKAWAIIKRNYKPEYHRELKAAFRNGKDLQSCFCTYKVMQDIF